MQAFQERVVTERKELVEKLDKLTEFLKGDMFAQLPDAEKNRLQRQHDYMCDYAAVLAERIANFQ